MHIITIVLFYTVLCSLLLLYYYYIVLFCIILVNEKGIIKLKVCVYTRYYLSCWRSHRCKQGIYQKYLKTFRKDICTPMLVATLLMEAKTWKQLKLLLIDGWIKNMWYIHAMQYYSATRKTEMLTFVTMWVTPNYHDKQNKQKSRTM